MNPKINPLAPCVASTNHGPRSRTQLGLSLIELMIALVIGLFLVMGAITVYLQSANTSRTSDKVARLQEVGRYAFDVLEPDVQLAGLWGLTYYMPAGPAEGNIENLVSDATISPNCGVNWIGDAANYVEGRDNGANLSATCTASNTGSDALVIRRTATATAAVDTSHIQVQSTRTAGTIFTGSAIPDKFETAGSATHDLLVHAYYVTQAAATGSPFILVRRTLSNPGSGFKFNPEDVIPGVQDLQIQFGIDRNGDNQADQYVDPNATLGNRVVSVRIWLLVVADESEMGFQDPTIYAYANRNYGTAFTDGRRRVLLSKTIQIRNVR